MTHVAVILAAGASRRLGRPKQLLTIAGETLVHRVARFALATAPTRVLVVVGADAEAIAAAVADLPCESLRNDAWASGLAGSLALAAAALTDDETRVLVLGCDQPRLDLAHLRRLRMAAAAHASACAASAYAGVVGVPAILPADWLRDGGRDGADSGLRQRLRAAAAGALARVAAPALADDVDTPEQLAAARAAGWLDRD